MSSKPSEPSIVGGGRKVKTADQVASRCIPPIYQEEIEKKNALGCGSFRSSRQPFTFPEPARFWQQEQFGRYGSSPAGDRLDTTTEIRDAEQAGHYESTAIRPFIKGQLSSAWSGDDAASEPPSEQLALLKLTPVPPASGQLLEERRSRGLHAMSAAAGQIKNAVASAALTTATHVLNAPVAETMKAAQAIKPGDFVIALMGVTGAGKTSFISLMTDESVVVGKNLKSCTTSVGIHKCRPRSDRRTVWLVDTPGFDDTFKSDADILKEIASWLVSAYDNQIFLTGIIYLHPIQDMRVRNSTMRNLRMFKKLVGPEGLARVVLATTFWSNVSEEEGAAKESQLCGEEDFWGYMLSRGSQVYRHYGNVESATVIVDALIHHQAGAEKMALAIQQEVAVEGKLLNETAAGRSLEDELRAQRLKFEADLSELKEALMEAIQERDKRGAELTQREAEEVVRQYKKADPANLAVEVRRGIRCCIM